MEFTITNQTPNCPCCSLSNKSYKLSRVYLEAAARVNRRNITSQHCLDAFLSDLLPASSPAEKQAFTERLVAMFAPPAGKIRMARSIHPDWMIVFLSAIGLVMAYQVSSHQPELFPVVGTLLGFVLLVYILARPPVLRRFVYQQNLESEEKTRVERAVMRWMGLYICACEPCIFEPATQRSVPLDQLRRLLSD